MSGKTIDEKVVEMKFNNKNFEANVAQSMSTLDKLKAKLNFSGATKGLESIEKASKDLDLSSMEKSIAAIENRFSTMGIVGMRVIQNLTDSAMSFVKKGIGGITSSIISGGKTRAQNLANARFQLQGLLNDASKVQAVMDDVDYGVSGTAYSLDAAAKVAAQLAASGMQAGDSLRYTLRGISGVAAMTNSSYEEIGNIYTTVAGNGRLMSMQLLQLSNRGMNAAAVLGKQLNKTETEIRDMVSKGQIDFNTFAKAMDEAFGEHAKAANETFTGALSNIKSALGRIGAEFYTPLIAQNGSLVKMLNAIRIHINAVKKSIEPVAKRVTDFINSVADRVTWFFNYINKESPFKYIKDALSKVSEPIEKVAETIKTVRLSMEELDRVAKRVINGDFKNQPHRMQLLADAGYNYYEVQNKVNEILGDSTRYSQELIEKQDKVINATEHQVSSSTEAAKSISELNDENIEYIETLTKKSEAELKSMGYSDEQIKALQDLKKYTKLTGLSIKDFIKNIDDLNGHWLITRSFQNIGHTLVGIFKAIGQAWREVFPTSTEDRILGIIGAFHKLSVYLKASDKTLDKVRRTFKGIFSAIHLVITILKGPLGLAIKVVGLVLKAFGVTLLDITAAIGDAITWLDRFITSVLNFTVVEFLRKGIEKAADAIKRFYNNVKDSKEFKIFIELLKKAGIAAWNFITHIHESWIVKKFIEYIKVGITYIEKWFNAFRNSKHFKEFLNFLEKSGSNLKTWFDGLKQADNIPKYIFQGLINGFVSGAGGVLNFLKGFAQSIIDTVRNVLGIHSPSTEFFAIGEYSGQGFINGIKSMLAYIPALFKNALNALLNMVKSLNIGTIITVALTAGIIKAGSRISQAVLNFSKPFESVAGVLDSVKGLIGTFTKRMNALGKTLQHSIRIQSIKAIALSILMLAGSLYIVSKIDPQRLWASVGAIGALTLMVAGMMALTVKLDKWAQKGTGMSSKNIALMVASLLAISYAIKAMAKVVKMLGKLSSEELRRGIEATTWLTLLVAGLVVISNLTGKGGSGGKHALEASNISDLGSMMLKIAAALLIMAIATKTLAKLDEKSIRQGIGVLTYFVALIVGLMAASKLLNSGIDMDSFGNSMLKIGVVFLIMAKVTKSLGKMDEFALAKGLSALLLFALIIAGLMWASKLLGKPGTVDKFGNMILKVGATFALMAISVKTLGKMDNTALIKGLGSITLFTGLIVGLMAATKLLNNGKGVKEFGAMMLGIGVAFGLMAISTKILGSMDFGALLKGLIGIGVLTGIIVLLMLAVKKCGGPKNVAKISASLLMISVAIGILAGIAVILGLIPLENLAKGIIAVGLLGGIMAALIISTKNCSKAMKPLLAMALIMGILAVILITLSAMDTKHVIAATTGLTAVMLSLALLMETASSLGKQKVSTMLKGLIPLVAVLLAMFIVVQLLKSMDDLKNVETNAKGLAIAMVSFSVALLAMAAVFAITGAMSSVLGPALIGTLVLVLIALGSMAAIVGILAWMEDIPSAAENAEVLGNFIKSIAEAMTMVAQAGPVALLAVPAMIALIAAIGIVALLATALGALTEKFPELKDFLNNGIELMIGIANGIGRMMAAFVDGFMTGIADSLPGIGLTLSKFMVNAQPFIMGAKQAADGQVKTGIITLVAAILALCAADVINAITEFIAGDDFATLGKKLSKFMTNAQTFIDGAKQLDAESMQGIESLVNVILKLTAANLLEGIARFVSGDNDFASFGTKLSSFGSSLSQFMKNMGDNFDKDKIDNATYAIEKIAKAAKEIPRSGGLKAVFSGDNDFGKFGDKMIKAGAGLKKFVESLGDEFKDDKGKKKIKNAVEVLGDIIKIAKDVPRSGGLKAVFSGDNDFGKFGDKMIKAGAGLKSFADSVGNTFDGDKTGENSAISNAMKTLKEMITIAHDVPQGIGLKQLFTGENDFGLFGAKLHIVGGCLKSFAYSVGEGFDEEHAAKVVLAINTLKEMITAAQGVPTSGGLKAIFTGNNDFGAFGGKLGAVGTGLKDFATKLGDFGNQDAATIDIAGKAIVSLAEASQHVPLTGGYLQRLIGEQDIEKFGEKLGAVGTGLKDFFTNLLSTGLKFDDNAVAAADCAGKAIVALADAADKIPPTDGWVQKIIGNQDLSKFSSSLGAVGTGLNKFITAIGTFSGDQLATVEYASNALRAIAVLANDALGAKLTGNKLGDELKNVTYVFWDVGAGVKNFVEAMSGVTDSDVESGANKFRTVLGLLKELENLDMNKYANFGNIMGDIAKVGVDGFATKLVSEENQNTMKDAIATLLTSFGMIFKTAMEDAKTYAEEVQVVVNAITQTLESFSGIDALKASKWFDKTVMTDSGATLMKGFAVGFNRSDVLLQIAEGVNSVIKTMGDTLQSNDNKKKVNDAGSTLGTESVTGLQNGVNNANPNANIIGQNFTQGFINGINSKKSQATAAASSLGKMASLALKQATDEHSPSKITHQIGKFFSMGFENGITSRMSKIYDTSSKIGTIAKNGLSKAISKVADLFDSDLDTQPTIRPVLDLSEIDSGIYAMNNMLNDSSITTRANIGAISSGMSTMRTTNDDVVSAINKLSDSLSGNTSGDTYNINGMTYDDGSSVGNAVKTLISAIKVEGRK